MIRRLRDLLDEVLTTWRNAAQFEQVTESIAHVAPSLPDGWPPHYGRQRRDDGRWVVTVCGVATSLPAYVTEEEARADAWERHDDDPEPVLAYPQDAT